MSKEEMHTEEMSKEVSKEEMNEAISKYMLDDNKFQEDCHSLANDLAQLTKSMKFLVDNNHALAVMADFGVIVTVVSAGSTDVLLSVGSRKGIGEALTEAVKNVVPALAEPGRKEQKEGENNSESD